MIPDKDFDSSSRMSEGTFYIFPLYLAHTLDAESAETSSKGPKNLLNDPAAGKSPSKNVTVLRTIN